jgi:hypothetical protein
MRYPRSSHWLTVTIAAVVVVSAGSLLAETKIYVDPPPGSSGGGHTFSRRTDLKRLERMDTPEQRDSWNRTWTFFEWHLRPYEDRSKSSTSQQ